MIRRRIESLLERLDRLFANDPSNHDAIEDAMETLARLAEQHPDTYRDVLQARGELELVDPQESRTLQVANLMFHLEEAGASLDSLPPTPDTFAGLNHADEVRSRAGSAARAPQGVDDPELERPIWFPHDKPALAAMLEQAAKRGCRVSSAGSWRSFSDVNRPRIPPRPGDVILGTSFLNRALGAVGDSYACETGRAVWQIIGDLHDRDQALINMGGGDFQTLGGAVSTGTHGSGRRLGDLASFVREVEVCTLDAHKKPVFRTLEGPDLAAAGVALGALGVVYSARFQVRERYHLLEKRLLMPWTDAKAVIRTHLDGRDRWRHLEVLVVPYPVPLQALRGKLHKANLSRYTRRRDIPDTGTLAVVTLRKEVPAGTPSQQRTRPLAMRLARVGFGRWLAYQGLDAMLHDPARIAGMLKSSMVRQRVDEYVGRWDEVLKLGLLLDATGAELSVPADQGIRAAELILAAARDRKAGGLPRRGDDTALQDFWRTRPMHTSPFALRFVRESNAWLSMAHGRDSCMIEMPMLQNPRVEQQTDTGARTALYQAYAEGRERMVQHVYDRVDAELPGVRPHWGLQAPATARGEDWARRSFPRWDDWMGVYRQFNLHGTFDSAFTDRMQISVRAR